MRSLLLSLALVALPSTLAFSSVNSVSALRLSTVSSFKVRRVSQLVPSPAPLVSLSVLF